MMNSYAVMVMVDALRCQGGRYVRALAAMPAHAGAVEGISLEDGTSLLLRLPERAWSAGVSLSSEQVLQAGKGLPERVAVVRDVFALYNQTERGLSQIIRSVGPSHVAIHADLARPATRMVVDEYQRTKSGSYELRAVARDLLRFLARSNVTASLIPDLSTIKDSESSASSSDSSTLLSQDSDDLSSWGSNAILGHSRGVSQSSNEVMMVAPTAFGFNEQTAQDNHFMHSAPKPGEGDDLTSTVLSEFANLHHQLTEVHGVRVSLMQHSLAHSTPDACFPNNWFSTHPAGEANGGCTEKTLVLYPMKCPNRAAERRPELIDVLISRGYSRIVDLTHGEKDGKYFEGTGVLVVDRINGVAYVSLSERADLSIAEEWVKALGYKELVTFRSFDARKMAVYHTNVMMAIGTGVAIVCGESVVDVKERQHLFDTLGKTHAIVDISLAQMDSLCGNALELKDDRGLPIMAMSTQAYNAFTPDQRATILRHCADIVHAPVDTIENVGGGGVRCTLAELF